MAYGLGVDLAFSVRSEDVLDRELEALMEAGYRMGVVLLGDPCEAQDAVQDAAILAWRKAKHVRDVTAIRAWFLSIVARQCRTRVRRPWRTVLKLDTIEREQHFDEEAIAQGLDVSAALARLSADDRLALYLHYYEDLTLAEAAMAAGCGYAAFRSRLYRALERLRAQLRRAEGSGR